MRRYYNHDHIWLRRASVGNPIWGSYSNKCYQDVVQFVGRFKFPPAKVLDLGCGAGAAGNWFTELGYKYTGIDESEVAIKLGQKHFPDLELRCIDSTLDVPSNFHECFDVNVSINVLHCLTQDSDRLKFLRFAYECLVESGGLFLTGMCLPKEIDFRQADSPRCYKSVEAISSEVLAAGFKKVELLSFVGTQGRARVSNATMLAVK